MNIDSYLFKDEAIKGERVALKFRWILIGVVLTFIVFTYIQGHTVEATFALIPASVFLVYNLLLGYLIRKGKNIYFLRYFSVSIDIIALSIHIYINSAFFSDIAVSTTASILIYPILMFLSVLRYDKKLIIFATIFSIFCFNLNYYLRLGFIEANLLEEVISSDPIGHSYKSGYLLLLGIFFLQVPDIVYRYIGRQKKILLKKNESELQLAIETKQKDLLQANLTQLNNLNETLKEKNLKIEDQNEQLNELILTKNKLISFISKDLKDSFSTMASIIETLKEHHNNLSSEDIQEATCVLHRHTKSNYQLFHNILEWAKAQSGEMSLHKEIINLSDIIAHQYELQKDSMCRKRVRFKSYVTKKQKIYADRQMMEIVLGNLINNACKFTEAGGEIEIDAVSNSKSCLISVKDSGIGIPKEQLDGLFEIGNSSFTEGSNGSAGSGFGLILCKELIRKNNGDIHVKSSQGSGSVFSITLPTH